MKILNTLIVIILLNNFIYSQTVEEIDNKIIILEKKIGQLSSQIKSITKSIDSLKSLRKELILETTVATSFNAVLKFNAKLKEKPDSFSKSISSISKDVKLKIFNFSNGYWQVKYKDKFGYILDMNFEESDSLLLMKNYYQEKANKEKLDQENEKKKIIALKKSIESQPRWIKSINANLRNIPNTNSEVLRKLKKGDVVFLQNQNGEWCNIKILNKKYPNIKKSTEIDLLYTDGWIHSSLLSTVEIAKLSTWQKKELEQDRKNNLRRNNFVKNNSPLPVRYKNALTKGQIMLGMTKEMVIASWGEPNEINRTVTIYGTSEQWIYGLLYSRTYLYFDDNVFNKLAGLIATNPPIKMNANAFGLLGKSFIRGREAANKSCCPLCLYQLIGSPG